MDAPRRRRSRAKYNPSRLFTINDNKSPILLGKSSIGMISLSAKLQNDKKDIVGLLRSLRIHILLYLQNETFGM